MEPDTQGTGIVYTADKGICQNITWKLESHTVYVNLKHVLKKGDGGERQVKYDVLTSELVNITTTTDICCPGFFEKHKGKCKSKFSKTSFKFMKFYPPAMFKIASEM
ncbi:uncharacterized protein LOC134681660 [Mytilus trossulus]|uniref:uncharacterized protein LOC134681660 n=1 Tax=Mytilus trossulus TaxID=6551 RepID=UPI003003B7A6